MLISVTLEMGGAGSLKLRAKLCTPTDKVLSLVDMLTILIRLNMYTGVKQLSERMVDGGGRLLTTGRAVRR